MKPEDVPNKYVQMMADAEFDAPAGCSAADSYRTVLVAVLPAHERQVREQVAAEIEARRCEDVAPDVCAKCSCRREDTQIARGRS